MKAYNLDNSFSVFSLGGGHGRAIQISCPSGLKDGSPVDIVSKNISNGQPVISIEKGDCCDNSWLARIDTKGVLVKGGDGNVSYDAVQAITPPVVIINGWGALHSAGKRVVMWKDLLVQVFDGTLLRVEPSKLKPYFLLFERDKVSKLSSEELKPKDLSFDAENKVFI